MDVYKIVKNLVLGISLIAGPSICERGCSYSGKEADAAEVQQVRAESQAREAPSTLAEKLR
jgi:hypothetical protein